LFQGDSDAANLRPALKLQEANAERQNFFLSEFAVFSGVDSRTSEKKRDLPAETEFGIAQRFNTQRAQT